MTRPTKARETARCPKCNLGGLSPAEFKRHRCTRADRPTAAERDERIVAEAGPWRNVTRWATPEVAGRQIVVTRYDRGGCPQAERAAAALARIANRIAKRAGKGKDG